MPRWRSRAYAYAEDNARQANIFGDNYAPIYFAPAAAPSRSLAQLPAGTRHFSGRTVDIADVESLIGYAQGPYVIDICGPPGVGKSALALHIAHRLRTRFGTQLYADLGEYNGEVPTAGQVLQRFVADLDPSTISVPVGARELPQRYRSLLARRNCLILLDDARTAEQVADLIPGNPDSVVLVTSRVALAALDGVFLHHLDLMGPDESLCLLTGAAGRRWSDAQDTDAARTLVDQCGRLPLALRIAGAILKKKPHWSPQRLVEELSDERTRLTKLVAGSFDVRSSFEVSYRTLAEDESQAFRILSLLPLTRFEARHAGIFLDVPEDQAERLLEALVDAQLVETNDGVRYRYHDLLKLFAREHCERADDDPDGTRAARFLAVFTSDFLKSYRDCLLTSHWSEGMPTGFARSSRRLSAPDGLYIPQQLARAGGGLDSVEWQDAVAAIPRVLVVGGPGTGKTVLADRICFEVARGDGRLFDVAFNVPLRRRAGRHQGLDQLITDSVRLRHGLDVPPETLELMLHRRRALLVFDGLDELTVTERHRARTDIVEFCRTYPDVTVIVTSRPGMSTDQFDANGFTRHLIEPFSTADVHAYVDKWMAATGTALVDSEQLRTSVTTPRAAAWVSSPLMLSQLLATYERFGCVPDGPVDLYARFYSTLFEGREAYRGIARSSVDTNTVGHLMCALAYEFVTRPGGAIDMSNHEFLRVLRRALRRLVPQRRVVRSLAQELFELLSESDYPVHRTSESADDAEPRWTLVRDPFGQYLAARAIAFGDGADHDFAARVVAAVRATGFVEGAVYVAALLEDRPGTSRELAAAVHRALGEEKQPQVREHMEQILRALG
ncbi:NACHT domain-containing protein [Streptomyces sp. NPDC002143]